MNKYKLIQIWGKLLGSGQYYIDKQIEIAKSEGAPKESLYKDGSGKWVTIDDSNNIEVMRLIIKDLI